MSRFVTIIADRVKEEYRTTILYDDLTLSRLIVYAQSIEKSKLSRIEKNFMRGGSTEQNQSRFKKRDPMQDGPSALKHEKGSGSQNGKPTWCHLWKQELWGMSSW